MEQIGPAISRFGLDRHGLVGVSRALWNLPTAPLVEQAVRRGEGHLARGGPFVATTGKYTGRSPDDKFIVDRPSVHKTVNWGEVNQPLAPVWFDRLLELVRGHLSGRGVFVQDLYAGADPAYRLPVRVVTAHAWHALFARNMFITPPKDDLAGFEPGFTVLHAPDLQADPEGHGVNSEAFIVVDFETRTVLVGGTSYAGEIKKSIFGVLNHLLPDRDVFPMHCSANIGPGGDVAIFFGLSGTGKTTLSADPNRTLIGDDEHGWSDDGIFNFEGGCYAKTIRLDPEKEPEIWAASNRFGAILENVVIDPLTGEPDFDDASLTENTRASYPLAFIPNASATGQAGHPSNIVMLTADAFGVLPPISRLTPDQAMYHFLSGYTARVAGTERGLAGAEATFSTCFGAPFMSRHPTVYAGMLGERVSRHGARCWLVNTGWTGGAYGEGKRIDLAHTRAMVEAALEGRLDDVPTTPHPIFGLPMPQACPGVPEEILDPRNTWKDKAAYDAKARELAALFEENFKQFEPHVDRGVRSAAIHAAA